jgi:hypothetical protein
MIYLVNADMIRWFVAGASVALLAGLGTANGARASVLGDMATQMRPGEWRELNRTGDGSGFNYDLLVSCTGSDCADHILNYADKALWNPHTREIHFLGQGHGGRLMKHISYGEASNRWVLESKPYWDCSPSPTCYSIVHGYEHSAIDPVTGNIYARKFNSTQVFKWTRATKTWSELPSGPNPAVAVALEYFPELGGLLLVGGGEVHLYRESTRTWTLLAQGLPMGPYSSVAAYNPVHKVAIVGGGDGSTRLYRVDSSGRVGAVANAPVAVGIQSSVFTVDPVSGKHLLFGSGGGFFEYDVASNTWSAANSDGVAMFAPGGNRILFRSAVPIGTHGVIAFLTLNLNDSVARVYLYRHAPGASPPPVDTTPPTPPTGITIQ